MAATTTMSPLRHYSPLREMIIDNCALFMKMPPSHIMIITEKSPAGQIVACAMVRGVAPGTVVCSDPSGDLDSALASLHDKSMRTVHCHRGGHGVQHHVSNRRPRLAPRDYSDDEDWLSDYDVLSETSDDTAMADWQDEEGSDTDDDAAQVSTPATTLVPSPLSVEDRVFDIVFSANWEGRGQHQFLARSPAGIKALQVAVLDYCRKYPTAFPGQVTPAKAVEQKSPKMPITTTASGMDHEDGSTLADDGGARSNGDSSSGSPAAKVAAGTTLQGSAVVSTAAGMPRPSPYEQRHSVTVWWNGGILTAKIRSAGSGDSAVKYDVKAYSGDSLAPFFRMISQSGKVPTVEVDIDFSGRSADATIMH
ncbi:uncharacterized protein B0I36DRAFT_358261 [Microdochium trichocladiopsis]|uniref:Uncharacterized protein n=1 Tax=Microdochium trichocladiopsis TaxID=1682393 RepID=A0A9P8YKD4_9PEZI|nr:uncharacterized protein B0I36DRAFT_358261 [Microdochium trichocladiopsis]KAH7041056.1 hypothetical protein B0I36DRAFT_358261 [Microdochium trichocladiopsis]